MKLTLLPEREAKPRKKGITMVMDKGLGISQARDLMSTAAHLIDFIKLGFGTSYVSNNVEEKVRLYQEYNIKVFAGGTLFEAFLIRNQLDNYLKHLENLGLDAVEVSDGSFKIPHEEKCGYIEKFSRDRLVLSEVGAKEAGVVMNHGEWVTQMKHELEAGSSYVIGEARESGNVGIYSQNGKADNSLINDILKEVPKDKIIWEAPLKPQQVWFIKMQGAEVNLGNIAPFDAVPLETLRLGLRGDTFFDFLPADLQHLKLE